MSRCARQGRVEPKLTDQLELSGIALSVVPTVADAVFGANFVIATDHTGSPRRTCPTCGSASSPASALLVNATGMDLPAELVDQVDQVYVDDLGLLDRYPERHVAATHLAEPRRRPRRPHSGTEPRIAGDLAQLLSGRHAGRQRSGDI